jgi:hypothetical protein
VRAFSLSLTRPARNQFALLSAPDRLAVRRLLGLIQLDPSIDNRSKIVFPMPPGVFTAYVTSQFWIVYHVIGPAIRVISIWRHAVNGQDY